MIDILIDILETALSYIIDCLSFIFDVLFCWLPDDPLSGYISDLSATVSSLGTGLHWLNWFIDINFLGDALTLLTVACFVYVGWSIVKELIQWVRDIRQATLG